MRAIRLCLVLGVTLAIWHKPVAGSGPPTAPADLKVIGGDQTEERLFYDGQFVYTSPPTPDITTDPKFHLVRFHATVSAEPTISSAPPPTSTPTATTQLMNVAATSVSPALIPMPLAVASPSPTYGLLSMAAEGGGTVIQAAPTATPFPPLAAASPTPTATPAATLAQMPTAFVLGGQVDPHFHKGMFRYTAPATPPPIDDPRFYRGSFTINEAGHLAPTPAAAPTSGAAAPAPATAAEAVEAQVETRLDAKKDVYTIPPSDGTVNVSVEAIVDTAVVTYDELNPSYMDPSPLPVRGRAMYYNPGIMFEVLSYRLQLRQVELCSDCVGYVALLRAGDLNRKVWLQWDDGSVEGPFLVIDVAARQHIPSLLARDWVVDVDYRTAIRHGMNRPIPVTVLAAPPAGGDKPTTGDLESMIEK